MISIHRLSYLTSFRLNWFIFMKPQKYFFGSLIPRMFGPDTNHTLTRFPFCTLSNFFLSFRSKIIDLTNLIYITVSDLKSREWIMKGIFIAVSQGGRFFMIVVEFFIIGEGHCVFIAGVGIVGICAIVKLFMSTQGRYTWRFGSFLWSLCRFGLCWAIFAVGNEAINSFIWYILFIDGR